MEFLSFKKNTTANGSKAADVSPSSSVTFNTHPLSYSSEMIRRTILFILVWATISRHSGRPSYLSQREKERKRARVSEVEDKGLEAGQEVGESQDKEPEENLWNCCDLGGKEPHLALFWKSKVARKGPPGCVPFQPHWGRIGYSAPTYLDKCSQKNKKNRHRQRGGLANGSLLSVSVSTLRPPSSMELQPPPQKTTCQ